MDISPMKHFSSYFQKVSWLSIPPAIYMKGFVVSLNQCVEFLQFNHIISSHLWRARRHILCRLNYVVLSTWSDYIAWRKTLHNMLSNIQHFSIFNTPTRLSIRHYSPWPGIGNDILQDLTDWKYTKGLNRRLSPAAVTIAWSCYKYQS